MKAVTWQGRRHLEVRSVPDPTIIEPTDAIVKITSTAICGSDLHLYEVLGPYLAKGDVLGHEPMGIVTEVGSGVSTLVPGDRVVIPFNISCGHCWMCSHGLQSQCETTQVRAKDKGASLFGYTELYGSVPGGQAEYLRVPHADYGPIKVDSGPPDEQFLFLSDIIPTAWQAVEYAGVRAGGYLAVYGLGPVGQFCTRIGQHHGFQVFGIDLVPERRAMAERHGITTIDPAAIDNVPAYLAEQTDGRGPDAVIDAVGMEAHGSPVGQAAQFVTGLLPDKVARAAIEHVGFDRMNVLHEAIKSVRRGGTVSVSGVYGGAVDPMPMMEMFDKQITLKMGQCNVHRWSDDIMPLVNDPADPLGTLDLTTHTVPLQEAPDAYAMFQKKHDGCIKVVLKP